MPERTAPEECANCGAAIPRGAKACPDCGADERTGWREKDIYDNLDLPDDAFPDDSDPAGAELRRRRRERAVAGIAWYWWCVGVALLVTLVYWMLGGR